MMNTNNVKQLAVFKALADPARLEIIEYLKHVDNEISCGEVGKALNISKTSGSYHFKILQEAGLINARKEAREKYVSLNPECFDKFITNFYKNI